MFIIYSRRSTDDANIQKNSLEYQESECRRYAERDNLEVSQDSIEGVLESGLIKERHSAYKSSTLSINGAGLVEYQIERPKFMQMISWLLEGKYDGVIVLCWDRISRNEQSDLIVKELIKTHNINVRFVQADYDVHSSSGQLHMDIDGMFARHHSRVTSEKVRITFDKLRAEKRCTYFSPIGYLDEGSDKKVFDSERAPTIKRLFELYGSGEWSISQLHKWAAKQGLTTKPRRRRRTRLEVMNGHEVEGKMSKPVSKSTIEFILTNPFYIGKLKHKLSLIEGGHPPLIDEELFERVQALLKGKCVTMHYMDKPLFTYRDIFRCQCGRAYTPYMQKGHIYYSCKCHAGCSNQKRNLKEDDLILVIQGIMDEIYFNEEELQEIEAGAQSGLRRAAKKRDGEIDDLNKRRDRIHKDLDYLKANKITLLRERAMSPADWKADCDKLLAETTEVNKLLEAYSETEVEMLNYVLTVSELVKNAAKLYRYATIQEKRQIAHLLFSELVLFNGKLVSRSAKPEFAVLLDRPRKASEQHVCENGSLLQTI